MKKIVALSSLLLAASGASAFAAVAPVIKTCATDLRFPETEAQPLVIYVLKDGEGYKAQLTKTVGEHSATHEEPVEISEHAIREGLSKDNDPYNNDLNPGELLISHAMEMSTNPIFEGTMSTGMDLSAVRKVKVYGIGKVTNMGRAAIVEASSADGKILGSFLGGFLVSPCK